jgi:hypothetical protein
MNTFRNTQYRIEQAIRHQSNPEMHPDIEESVMNCVAIIRKRKQSMMRDRYLSILFLGIVFVTGCAINFSPNIIPGNSIDPAGSNILWLFRFCFVLIVLLQFDRQVLSFFKHRAVSK